MSFDSLEPYIFLFTNRLCRFLVVHIFLFTGFALAFHIQHQNDSDTIESNVGDGGPSRVNSSAVTQNNESQQKDEESSAIMAEISKVMIL